MPVALMLLGLPPLIGGAVRVLQLAGGPEAIELDPRFEAAPLPVFVHVAAISVYALLGAFQFSPGLRRRFPKWHRVAGRVTLIAGVTVALSALWMTIAYPFKPGTGWILFFTRLVVATAMTFALTAALVAIRRRRIQAHRAWMIRAYALGLGAATQLVTLGFGEAVFGRAKTSHDLLMAAGWVVNALVAERLIIRSRLKASNRRPATVAAVGSQDAREGPRRDPHAERGLREREVPLPLVVIHVVQQEGKPRPVALGQPAAPMCRSG